MGFSDIIKKAWRITWHYRALWVLGLFAGITGASGGGGGSGGSNPGSSSGTSSFPKIEPQSWVPVLQRLLPLIIVLTMGFFLIGLVWWVLSVAARGGLVYAVNEIESGRPFALGASWSAGFRRFWSLFGLSLLLSLPVLILVLLVVFGVLAPMLPFLIAGRTPPAAAVAPICGVLAIGIPALIVIGLILGIMYVLGTRFVMLGGLGAIDAARESWRAFRTRFKDTVLMYLINLGLNIVGGLVLAIPLVIVGIVVAIPAAIAAASGHWGGFAGALGLAFLIIVPLSLLYTAIWGTFTSSLWTIFYRRLTGMEVVPPPASYPPASGPVNGYPPPQPAYAPQAPAYPPPPAPQAPAPQAPAYPPPPAPAYPPPPAPPAQPGDAPAGPQ